MTAATLPLPNVSTAAEPRDSVALRRVNAFGGMDNRCDIDRPMCDNDAGGVMATS